MTREEAINQLKDFIILHRGQHGWDVSTLNALEMAIKALEQRWIPVSERLPKIGEQVMVTLQHEFEEETVEITTYSKYGFYIQPVIAWMPLPEPYKGRK